MHSITNSVFIKIYSVRLISFTQKYVLSVLYLKDRYVFYLKLNLILNGMDVEQDTRFIELQLDPCFHWSMADGVLSWDTRFHTFSVICFGNPRD